ncbi:MAG: Hsp20/alpha crystallin family protein [Candidatus Methylomirabilia bacterium]
MALERWRPFGGTPDSWEPFRALTDIQTNMNRLFDTFFGHPVRAGIEERAWRPVLDIYETKDELVVAAELPGFREKEIQVTISGDLLSIRGQRSEDCEVKEQSYHRVERSFGKFERNIPLPIPVQSDRVKAQYRAGVLEIRLPKVEEAKPKEITIEVK